MNKLDAIKVLILINAIFFVIAFVVPNMEPVMFEIFALYFPQNDSFKIWQFVTNMFMHGGFMHILLNMYALWAFGTPLEYMWGKKKFILFYFLSGIGASLIFTMVNYYQFQSIYDSLLATGVSSADIQTLLDTGSYSSSLHSSISDEELEQFYSLFHTPAVGASGAIYGILVAFGYSFPNAKLALIFLPVPIAAKYFVPVLIAIDLFSGLTGFSIFGGNIAHFAHVGGAIIGFLLMLYWRKTNKLPHGHYEV